MKTQSIPFQAFSWNKALTILLIVVMLLAAMPVRSASADSTDFYSPQRVTANGRGWSNPFYALASDNLYSTAVKNNKQLKLSSFFIPAIQGGATITGIEVEVEGLTAGKQVEVSIQGNSGGFSTSKTTTFTGTETTLTLGNSSDTWGKSWSAVDFQNKFTVKLSVTGTGGAVSIDSVRVKVYFAPSATTLLLAPVAGNYGESATMTATLTQTGGGPLAGKQVSFSLNGVAMGIVSTNGSGVATLNVSLAGINAADYPYGAGAAFAGDATNPATSITADLRVYGIATTLSVGPISAPYGGSTDLITATLTQTVGGAAISGKTINLILEEVVVGTAVTDGSGVASFSGIDMAGFDPGNYTGALEVAYAGELNIEPASVFPTLTVNGGATLTVTANNQTMSAGSPDPVFTFSYSGFVGSDTSADIDTPPTCSVSGNHSAPGTYPIVCSGGVDNVYGFSYVNGTLTVNAVAGSPTDIAMSDRNIDEQLPVGTVVGTFSTTDPDAGETFTYSFCGGADDASFTIDGNSLKSAAAFNWVTKRSYNICVRSTDSTALSITETFVISINKTTATFQDVPTNYWAWMFIERLYAAGITGGCSSSPLLYCPEQTVTRAQMAVFLERGIHGASFLPPAVGSSTGFNDVLPGYWADRFIKQLVTDGITVGCGGGNYCPENPVTRAQMAVFLLRSEHGASYTPPAVGSSTGFTDVPPGYWADAFIKQLVAEGITVGCGGGNYCPEQPVTRAQMAVFLVRTFGLP